MTRIGWMLVAAVLIFSACSGGEGAKCAKDADCGAGLVCLTASSPTLQPYFLSIAPFSAVTRRLPEHTCVDPETVLRAANAAASDEIARRLGIEG